MSFLVNDAVHGMLEFSHPEWIRHVWDQQVFQRLRHIKQLGLVELIFPTASHNRFSHSLGAAYLADQMSQQLELSPEKHRYAVLGALLHDIGHGPFSHALEHGLKGLRHEMWTSFFLEEMREVLEPLEVDSIHLGQLIEHQCNDPEYFVVSDIISSQLDADRLDYLRRDSLFCGVSYGDADLGWIIRHLTVLPTQRLGILEKGWRSVEHFLLCRRMMTQNIYHHPKKSVLEKLLIIFLQEVRTLSHELQSLQRTPLGDFLQCLSCLEVPEDLHLSLMSHRDAFQRQAYPYYRLLTDADVWFVIRELQGSHIDHPAVSIARLLYRRHMHRLFSIQPSHRESVEAWLKELYETHQAAEWEIFFIQSDVQSYLKNDGASSIGVLQEGRTMKYLEEYSPLLRALQNHVESEMHVAVTPTLLRQNPEIERFLNRLT